MIYYKNHRDSGVLAETQSRRGAEIPLMSPPTSRFESSYLGVFFCPITKNFYKKGGPMNRYVSDTTIMRVIFAGYVIMIVACYLGMR